MDLNLEAAFDEPIDLSHQFELPTGRLDRPELVSLSPVAFRGRLERQGAGFLLGGHVAFDGVVSCARCLAPVSFRRAADVSWILAPAHEKPRTTPKAAREEKAEKAAKPEKKVEKKAEKKAERVDKSEDKDDGLELTTGDLDVLYYDELVLPLDPLVEEQVQLELPMKALCRDDCRGLCPTCGADRNLAPCGCRPPTDERWKSLRTLFDSGN
jgi:uncharacterized protein